MCRLGLEGRLGLASLPMAGDREADREEGIGFRADARGYSGGLWLNAGR